MGQNQAVGAPPWPRDVGVESNIKTDLKWHATRSLFISTCQPGCDVGAWPAVTVASRGALRCLQARPR